MSVCLQIRESISELLFSDKYDTEDTELLVQRRFEKKSPLYVGRVIENPVFRKICKLMEIELDHYELRDLYFSAEFGGGSVFVFRFKDTEYFMALDLHRDKVAESDAVTLAVCCDARKYVKLKELFELLRQNNTFDNKQDITDAPLIKAVLEANGDTVFYKGSRIPIADRELVARISPDWNKLLLDALGQDKSGKELS